MTLPLITEKCGCQYRGARWIKLCTTHEAETDQLHRQALLDHNQRVVAVTQRIQLKKEFTK